MITYENVRDGLKTAPYGIIAPVRTIVLCPPPGKAAARTRAVSTIVSVPCVTTIRDSAAVRHLVDDERAVVVGHVEAVDHR